MKIDKNNLTAFNKRQQITLNAIEEHLVEVDYLCTSLAKEIKTLFIPTLSEDLNRQEINKKTRGKKYRSLAALEVTTTQFLQSRHDSISLLNSRALEETRLWKSIFSCAFARIKSL